MHLENWVPPVGPVLRGLSPLLWKPLHREPRVLRTQPRSDQADWSCLSQQSRPFFTRSVPPRNSASRWRLTLSLNPGDKSACFTKTLPCRCVYTHCCSLLLSGFCAPDSADGCIIHSVTLLLGPGWRRDVDISTRFLCLMAFVVLDPKLQTRKEREVVN